ncbi:MAG: hypothetical protein JWQ24_188 [Tardiphaga sp.]|nr:hypothetical protein [Tardiphaga sp.]
MELDAAPARGVRTLASGRPGVTVRAYYEALPLAAGRGSGEGWRKLAGSADPMGPHLIPEVTVPRTEKPRWRAERRRGPRGGLRMPSSARDLIPGCACRRVIPLGLRGANRKARFALWRETDGACARGIFSGRMLQERRGRTNTRNCHRPRKRAPQSTAAMVMDRGSACTGSPLRVRRRRTWRGRHAECRAPDLRSDTAYRIASGERHSVQSLPSLPTAFASPFPATLSIPLTSA